jgi:hypothetical protein
MKTTTLYYNDGARCDKTYTASVDRGIVQFAWGRRGGTMQTKTVGPLPEAEALRKRNWRCSNGSAPRAGKAWS